MHPTKTSQALSEHFPLISSKSGDAWSATRQRTFEDMGLARFSCAISSEGTHFDVVSSDQVVTFRDQTAILGTQNRLGASDVCIIGVLYTACSDYDFKEIQEGENVSSDTASSNNVNDTGTSSTVTDSGDTAADTAITEDPDVATGNIYL